MAELQDLADRAGDYRLVVLGLRGLRFGECVALGVRMLGHKDAAMTLNVYASLFENDLDDVSDRLDAALPQAAAAVCSLDSRRTRRTSRSEQQIRRPPFVERQS